RLQERALDEIALGEDVVLDAVLVVLAGGLGESDRHHLRGIVPLIDRARDVETLVALQADEAPAERGGEDLGDLRLADAGLALEEQGPPEPEAQENDGSQRAVADIGGAAKQAQGFVDRGRKGRLLPGQDKLRVTTRRRAPQNGAAGGSSPARNGTARALPLPLARQGMTRKAARDGRRRARPRGGPSRLRRQNGEAPTGPPHEAPHGRAASARGRGHAAGPPQSRWRRRVRGSVPRPARSQSRPADGPAPPARFSCPTCVCCLLSRP